MIYSVRPLARFLADHTRPGRGRPAFRPTLERLEPRETPSVAFAAQQTFAAGDYVLAVTTGDFNGDGRPDVVTANLGDSTVSVLLNRTAAGASAPSFAAQTTFFVGLQPESVAVGDFNGDGRPDIAAANLGDDTVSVLLNTTATGATTPSFAAQVTFAVGVGPRSVTAADLNNDGRPDLVVANEFDNTVSVLMNTGPGGALFAAHQTFAVGSNPFSVAAADFNGDGRPDLAVADYNNAGAGAASVLLNTTPFLSMTASFAAQKTFAVGSGPVSVAAADFNGDGRPDLAVANSVSNTASVLLDTTAAGAGLPSFAPQQTVGVGGNPFSVTAADFSGDGRPDLAVANDFSNTTSVLVNTTPAGAAAPSFAPQVTFAVGPGPGALAEGDFNGDGRPDLAVDSVGPGGPSTVSVLLNTTTPFQNTLAAFAPQQTFGVGSGPVSAAVGDFNGDGKPDLVVVNGLTTTASVLLNTTPAGAAAPSFAPQVTFAVGSGPASVAVGDFNGDGKPDIAVADHFNGRVSVLLNTTPAGAATPSFAPAVTFTVGAGPSALVAGDLNGDGRPDLVVVNESENDVSVLLNTAAGAAAPSFTPQKTFAVGKTPGAATVADFNGDGRPDLAVADLISSGATGQVSLLRNTTAAGATIPSFAAQQTFDVGSEPASVAAADFNGDGRPDLVTVNGNGGSASVRLNTTAAGATTFSFGSPPIQETFAVGQFPVAVAVGDFNGDGRPDLAVTNGSGNTVSVLLDTTAAGAAFPTFAAQQVFAVGVAPQSVAAADFNGDGRPDLAVVNYNGGGGTVSVLRDTTAPFATATPVVAADVPGLGVVEYNRTTGQWVQLNAANPSDVTLLAADAAGDVFADYPGYGVFRYTPSLGSWRMVNGTDAVALAVDARGDAFLSYNGAGVAVFRLDGSSQLLTPSTASMLAADPDGDLAGEFVGYGVSRYSASNGSWATVNGTDAQALAIDAEGDVFASFAGAGVAEFRPTGGGQLLTPAAASLLAVDAGGDLAADFTGYGVQRYARPTGAWAPLNGADAAALAVDAADDVFASFPGAGVGEFLPSGAGSPVGASAAWLLAADPFGDPLAPL